MTATGAPEVVPGTLGIVVVNYGSAGLIERNLGSVDLAGLPVRVVVVDNFSSPAERDAIDTLTAARGWELVALPDNRGFGAGVNAGIEVARRAGCVCFLLLNPDASVGADVVEELRRHSLREPLALLSPRVLAPGGGAFFEGARVFLDSGRIRSGPAVAGAPSARNRFPSGPAQEWVSGACLTVHDQLLQRIGPFDERYFLYWEDVDLSHRCAAVGGTLVLRSDLTALHDAGGTQGPTRGSAKSALYYYFNCRNRLMFAARHLSRVQLLRWMLLTPAVSREILLRGGRRQLLRQPSLALAALRGSAAGLGVAAAALVRRRRRAPRSGSVLVAHPGADLYGSDRMLIESVRGLLATGRRVVVALPGPGPLVAALEALGASVLLCRMPVLRRSGLTPRGLVALLGDAVRGFLPAVRLIRRAGTDGVYVSTITIPYWSLLARLLGRPVTGHVHEADSTDPRLVRWLLGIPTLLAHRVLVNSAYTLDVLTGSVPGVAGRSVVVYNGIAGPAEVVPPRPRLTGPVRLTYVGRLSPRKGPQVAVAAAAELQRRGIDVQLTLAGAVFPGGEWFETELRRQVTEGGLEGRVEFRGFVSDVWDVLSASDVALVPALLDESFGNTAAEAVLAARPVIASGTSGLREAVAGYASAQVAPPGAADDWADAVERIVRNWPRYARDAVSDAAEAARRHDPARYRSEVARVVGAARGGS